MSKSKDILALMITDDHLTALTSELSISIHRQAREKAKELGLSCVYHTGDIIDSRKAQPWPVLRAMRKIISEYEDDDLELRIIPGNHSKPDYESEESFLDVFDRYDNFTLVRDHQVFEHTSKNGTIAVHMVPYFDEKVSYGHYLKKAIKSSKQYDCNVLLTHIGVNGVTRNDGTDVENDLESSAFKFFDKVFVGHFHDYQLVGDNIIYYGSTHQHNFGENSDDKGMTVLYSDLSYEQVPLDTPKYVTTTIEVTESDSKSVVDQIKQLSENSDYNRVKIKGTKESIAAVDKVLKKTDIKAVKLEKVTDDPFVDVSYADLLEFKGFDTKTILDEWPIFIEQREVEQSIADSGLERLKKIL